MTVFSALKSNCHRSGYFVHTSYDVYTIYIADSVPFGEGLSVNITNMKYYLFIAIIIAETKQNVFIIIQFQHIAFEFTESDINRSRNTVVNKQFTD